MSSPIVICPEHELFEDYLLPSVPDARIDDVIYFAPGRSSRIKSNPFLLEPGEDRGQRSAELLSVVKRAVGEEGSLGNRSEPMLANGIGALVGRGDACLLNLRRLLVDSDYRARVVMESPDPYVTQYWTQTFPQLPRGSEIPTLNRLDAFLRTPAIRDAVAGPASSFSLRRVIEERKILFCDLSGLSPENMRLVGEFLIAALQLEFLHRERMPASQRHAVHIYVDEFPAVAGISESSWLTLLGRGRKYGAALTLAAQHPGSLSSGLRESLFANISTMLTFNLSARDGAAARREFLVAGEEGELGPVSVERLVSLGVGAGIGRIGTGSGAMHIRFRQPVPEQDRTRAERVRARSWALYGVEVPGAKTPLRREPTTAPVTVAEVAAGRGGTQHRLLQRLVQNWGEAVGFRCQVELPILGGEGRVDVALESDRERIAVEVAVTSTPDQTLDTVVKALSAGFPAVIVVASDPTVLSRAEAKIKGSLSVPERRRVRFLSPEGLRTYLQELAEPGDVPGRTVGYRVVLSCKPCPEPETSVRRRSVARLLACALMRSEGREL